MRRTTIRSGFRHRCLGRRCLGRCYLSRCNLAASWPGQTHPVVFVWGKVGGVEGVFRSDDVGATWIKLHDNRWGFAELRALTGDPARFGRVYLGVHGRGILYGDPQATASAPAQR